MPINNTFWKGKRVLVTGGAGFVGRWLCRSLRRAEADIHLLDLQSTAASEPALTFHRANLCDLEATRRLLADLRPTAIIHLAGQPGVQSSHENPLGAFESNVTAAFNLFEACRLVRCAEAIVAVSSNHVYGDQHATPTIETAPLNGHGMYASTKLASDVLARAFGKSHGLPIGIARITNSYGGDDHHLSHIVTATILSALKNESPIIKQSGRDRKAYSYIPDTVSGLLAIAQGVSERKALNGEAFNIVPDEPIAVVDLVRLILTTAGATCEPRILNPSASFEVEFLDNGKARSELGWRPHYDYATGLAETVRWYRDNPGFLQGIQH